MAIFPYKPLQPTSGLAQVWRTELISASFLYCSSVFGLTISHPPADLATLLVCWLVWWFHQNLRSLLSASAGRTVIKFHTFAKPMTLPAILVRHLHRNEETKKHTYNFTFFFDIGFLWSDKN